MVYSVGMSNLIKKTDNRGGLLRMVIYIIVILLILSYFGLNIRAIVNSPTGQDNFTYVQQLMVDTWNGYLKKPVLYLWNDIFLDLIWNPAIDNLQKIKDGDPTNIQMSTPTLTPPRQIPN